MQSVQRAAPRVSFLVCAAAVLLTLSAACATAVRSGASPRTVTVTSEDSGRTVTLSVGDFLVIDLGPRDEVAAWQWVLDDYPKAVLSPSTGDPGALSFAFEAVEAGDGLVRIVGRVRCEGGPAKQVGGPNCPLAGAGPGEGAAGGMPVRQFLLTVRVR